MKKPSSSAMTAIAILIFANATRAETVIAYARNGADVGTGASNPVNGAAWGDPSSFSKPANAVNSVTTTLIEGIGNGTTPQVFKYKVVDTTTGVDFDFTVTFTAFANNSGSYDGDQTSVTWLSDPAPQNYLVFFSPDLISWEELNDSFQSQGATTTYIDPIAERYATLERPLPPKGFYRVQKSD